MIVLGLTGSIGMGKSKAGQFLRRMHIPVHDADAAVHKLMGKNGRATARVEAAFPGVVKNGVVDRLELGKRVFSDGQALRQLERILHPLVRIEEKKFLAAARRLRKKIAVLEVPLLFESGGERRCDFTILVQAPPFLQRQRVLRRPGMTVGKFESIRAKQMSEVEKAKRADFIIGTGIGYRHTLRGLLAVLRLFGG